MNRLRVYARHVVIRLKNIRNVNDVALFGAWMVKSLLNVIYVRKHRRKAGRYRGLKRMRFADQGTRSIFSDVERKIDWIGGSVTLDSGILALDAVDLRVPVIDMLKHNPSGWVYHADVDDVAYGIGRPALNSNRHHVEYVADGGTPLMEQSRHLLRIAARGVPVFIREDHPELARHLGHRVYSLMRNRDIVGCDLEQRERHSVSIRREALRNHGLYGRLHRLSMALDSDLYQLPAVSVIVATKRPRYVRRIVRMIDLQTYPNVEVILALHGNGFESGYNIETPSRVIRVASEESLGKALRYATDLARGELIAKMDDDDLYDIEHLWDLVLAHQYSSAALVSKTPKYHYWATSGRLSVGGQGLSEMPARYAIGATLLIERDTLDLAGGWPDVHHGEELELSRRVRKLGKKIYRTHGCGYVYMRYDGSDHEHTSQVKESAFHLHLVKMNTTLRNMGFSDLFQSLAEHERFP